MLHYTKFIESINTYIINNDLTITEFARKIKLSERCVARWLDGTNIPSTANIIKVADYLNVSIDYLFEITDNPTLQATQYSATIADRLRLLRASKPISKHKLAKIINVEPTTISKWENGTRTPKPDIIYILADFFSCSMDYLLGRTDLK